MHRRSSSSSAVTLSLAAAVMMLAVMMIVLCADAASTQAKVIRGAAPASRPLYRAAAKSGSFTCVDGSKTIPFAAINDDYCDCPDGSDEPGTSACPRGSFYCPNKRFVPTVLPSSRVNDGVCDCCDGTDELGRKESDCDNTCEEAGESLRLENEQKLLSHQQGMRVRFEHIKRGLTARKERTAKLRELKATLATEKAEDERLKAIKDEADALEKPAKEAHINAWNAVKEARRLEREAKKAEEDAAAAAAAAPEAASGEPTATEPAVDEKPEVKAEPEEPMPPFPEDVQALIDAANRAQTEWAALHDRATATEREVNALDAKLNTDLGPEQEFFVLQDECFSFKTNEYQYEVCPFVSAKQKQNDRATSLGSWTGWSGSGNKYSQMKFENGEKCWNGPNRSATVNLKCGDKNALISVAEPSKCEYVLEFTSPAACDPNFKLEQVEDDIEGHDEL
ncbi:hypothetical protein CAOG_07498 [Capsaspora owczarzaki ATCC 30864]|uniref:Glucosidase 2 subunit beta n=1 Tax=Capsaspora owczarzaki (strain ATCC 30864) TaxID=595528 RepID=A0A0D2WVU9_CAPO3|nr:hypothetical protein CAOG_07498 [Capsaspora owczarzaki ATCC 30864]KJE97010.1 hypothetical protein CAOG_007498 [Capsaspora owczarzaki ATCC 30864]|eukprot:XP_004343372.2 hypothetical protein CAOG_07498 [Capsaspora owczarzaki ATCC 30864]